MKLALMENERDLSKVLALIWHSRQDKKERKTKGLLTGSKCRRSQGSRCSSESKNCSGNWEKGSCEDKAMFGVHHIRV